MSDGTIFVAVIGGLTLARIVLATVIFLAILPEGVACPHCDHETIRVQARGWNLLLPWFRTSWCAGCGWEGLLRHEPRPVPPSDPRSSGRRAATVR